MKIEVSGLRRAMASRTASAVMVFMTVLQQKLHKFANVTPWIIVLTLHLMSNN